MIRSLPQSRLYSRGFRLYILLYFLFLFAPLLVTCILAFNNSQFPSLPWKDSHGNGSQETGRIELVFSMINQTWKVSG